MSASHTKYVSSARQPIHPENYLSFFNVQNYFGCARLCEGKASCNAFSINVTTALHLLCMLFNFKSIKIHHVVKDLSTEWPKFYEKSIWLPRYAAPEISLLGKSCSQTSVAHQSGCNMAIDGNLDQNCCYSHTLYSTDPWWQVDFGERITVVKVMVYNRFYISTTYLEEFDIYVQDVAWPHQSSSHVCVSNAIYPQDLIFSSYCNEPAVGRFLVLSRTGASIAVALIEVRVFGY